MLFTNGDSFTYGDELKGSRPPEGELPSHHSSTYSHHLANHLDCRYLNLAHNGSSNIKIYRRTMDFLQTTSKKIDYMVIIWSSWGRLEVCEPFDVAKDKRLYIDRETDMNQLIPAHRSSSFWYLDSYFAEGYDERNEATKTLFESLYTMHTSIVHSLTYMKNIQFICDLMNIRLVQGVIHQSLWNNILITLDDAEKHNNYHQYRDFIYQSLDYLRDDSRVGLGCGLSFTEFCEKNDFKIHLGGHPDEQGHEAYAEYLYQIINKD